MKYDGQQNEMILSSGRRFYCFSGYLSIRAIGEQDGIYYGWDGGAYVAGEDSVGMEDFTPEEKKEIASIMVNQWSEWGGL